MKTDFVHPGKVKALAAGNYQDARPSPKRRAVVDWNFAGQPSAADTITVNGVSFEFVANGAAGNQINIGADVSGTIDNAVTVLNASVDTAVLPATYSNVGGTKLRATVDAYGDGGNTFASAENSANITVDAAQGGVTADPIDLTAETYALATVDAAGGATDCEWDLPAGDEGQEVTLYLADKGTSSNAKVNGTFTGGTVLTLDNEGEFAKLKFLGGTWRVIANTGAIA